MSNPPTDCLVLRIDEIDPPSLEPDTTLYVLYDANYETFVIRGKRSGEWQTHSFYCDTLRGMADFISTVMCKHNLWSYTLYNFDNLLLDSDDITYGSLEELSTKDRELTGYDLQDYNRKELKKMLRILRNVYNYY